MNWIKKIIARRKLKRSLEIERHIQIYNKVVIEFNDKLNEYRKENQSLAGKIRNLEEQHDIMHNFLVEINKYLVKFSESKTDNKTKKGKSK